MSYDSRLSPFRFRRIGEKLRAIRQDIGWTLDTAGRVLDRSPASLSAIENGQQAIRPRDLKYILDEYGVTDPAVREPLLALAGQGRQKGWWHTFDQRQTPFILDFASLESDASAIQSFELHLMPGLLQTADYTRAVIGGSGIAIRTQRDVEVGVEFRMARQRILNKPNPPQLSVVLGEAALRQQIGGPEVMRGQLNKLMAMSQLPHVTIQVMPFTAAIHPGVDGAFAILNVGPGTLLQVAVTHSLTRSWYVDEPPDVAHYAQVFDRLREVALSATGSRKMIERLLSET